MISKAAKLSEHIRETNPATAWSLARRRVVHGVGVNDADYNVTRIGEWECPAYDQWKNMLARCYSAKRLERNPTYAGCHIAEEWTRFMNFRKWWIENHRDGWQIDKDLLAQGGRSYSPEACLFVPKSINVFLVDSGASRGGLPIGVSWNKGAFVARCNDGRGTVWLGRFQSAAAAHLAWQKYKLARLEDLRAEMDAIDPRIYVNAKAKILSYSEGLNL